MIKAKSLQRELYKWILISAAVLLLSGGLVAGVIAYNQAEALQDNTLREMSLLVRFGKMDSSDFEDVRDDEDDDEDHEDDDDDKQYGKRFDRQGKKNRKEKASIIIQELGKGRYLQKLSRDIDDGLQTIELDSEEWRILTVTQYGTNRRFVIAQQTELRDSLARSSALSAFYPMLIFLLVMLVLIHIIIRRQFKPLNALVKTIDEQDGSQLNKLTEDNIPQEITPFIRSINALMERVQQVLHKQQRFIADAAHELRTPITALSLQAENLKQAKDEQDRDSREEKLKQGFVRLGKLVSQLLDLARLQSGKEGEFQTVSFNQIVQEIIASNYPMAEADNIDLGMLRQDNDIYVKDQNGRLSQLVQNAIGNAIHYTPKNGKIDVSLFIEGQKAVLLVEDSGMGIPDAELEQVMQPFYRVLEGNQPGNGLGLAISQEIAERLGGKIQLSNRVQGGLCFRYEQRIVKR